MRDLIRILTKMLKDSGFSMAPIKVLNEGPVNTIIRAYSLKDDEGKSDRIYEVKHDLYEKLESLGFKSNEEKTKPSTGETQITFHMKEDFVLVNTIPSEKFDFSITLKRIPLKMTASESKGNRISYRLPRLKRGTLGTGEYSVHVGDKQIGRIWCTDKNNHDPNKANWCAELYEGFDHLAYPDNDKEDVNKREPHVVYDKTNDNTKLFSGESFTMQQSRHWITSVFDRKIWESGLVPY